MGKKPKKTPESTPENTALLKRLLPGLVIENFGLLKARDYSVPFVPNIKFYGLGFTGFKGDEDKHYAA